MPVFDCTLTTYLLYNYVYCMTVDSCTVNFSFVAKPIMVVNFTTIRKDQSTGNVMLTCAVKYSYPTAVITWNVMTESSSVYDVVEENSTGNYVLLNNGSLEVYRRFIYEEDHVIVMCLASNKYGSAKSVFSIWDDEHFSEG